MPKKSDKKKRIILLDSHAIIHRAYHALPEFATASGQPTGALYGLNAMLMKMIEELRPDGIAATFDLSGPTHRHEAYDAYKAGRKPTDDALSLQIDRAKDLFNAWGIPVYSSPGFEADDILGTIVDGLKKNKNVEIIIASGDMDTMQLVRDDEVQVYTLKKGLNDTILYNEKRVIERFGFDPKLLPDYKGLRGDPSDNIIGVPGIGEKTATSLIQTFGTVEQIYKALKKDPEAQKKAGITERIKNILLDNEEEALFSKTLATIRCDAPINFVMPDYWPDTLDQDRLADLYKELEFRTMGERLKNLLKKVHAASDGGRNSEVVGAPGERVKTSAISSTKASKKSSEEVEDKVLAAGEYASPEIKELALMLWVADSNMTTPTLEDVLSFTKTADLKLAREILEKELEKRGSKKIFEEIEKPLIPVVEKMNETGIKVDAKVLKDLSKTYHKELEKLEKSIWKHAGEEFNVNSPKVLGEILFVKMGLGGSRQKKTATGNFSTKESELEKLRDKHPIIEDILNYRELSKLLSTYIDTIPNLLDDNSRLHSTFQQAGAATGRMSSTNPNLQNIPIKTELGRAIRHAFVASEGYKLVALDYSQIELRIAAILSEDEKLIDIFKNGEDAHTGVASRVFKVKPEEVDREMRRRAKVINFGILYGMGVTALKGNLGTDRAEAQEFYNQYFDTFKTLAQYLDSVKADAERKGYTETLFGRRRYFAGFKSPLPFIRASAERMAINAPIQGTATADIVKIAMKRIDDYIKESKKEGDIRMLLQVHDELIFEVKENLVNKAVEDIRNIMQSVIPDNLSHGVPIVAEAKSGLNWGEMAPMESRVHDLNQIGKK